MITTFSGGIHIHIVAAVFSFTFTETGFFQIYGSSHKMMQNPEISVRTVHAKTRSSNMARAFLFLLSALVQGVHSLDYSDLESLGISCPERDKCESYRNNLTYLDRSCECDSACHAYGDCCIDADQLESSNRPETRYPTRNGMVCMPYGKKFNAGVYVIPRCSSNWTGSLEVRQKCETPTVDYSDPLLAAPVTSVAESKTYKNRYCAECNNAALSSLTPLQPDIACDGLQDLPGEQLYANVTYNRTSNVWGITRLNSFGNATQFYYCEISFDVPDSLNNSVRFCRSNLISTCPTNWTRRAVRRACDEYMAVVHSDGFAFRNPHCAICNGLTVLQVSCTRYVLPRGRPRPISDLVNIANPPFSNQEVKKRLCSTDKRFDFVSKKCRPIVCSSQGYRPVNGRCVRG